MIMKIMMRWRIICYHLKQGNRNAQVEIREPGENDFVSNDTDDVDIELESDKELDKS